MPLIQLISDYQMAHAQQTVFDHGRKDFSVVTTSCIREQRLPGSWMLYGRLMNTLQLYSLQEFAPEALNCLAEATQLLARRLLLSALSGRRCCRIVAPSATERQETDSPLDPRASASGAEQPRPRRFERTAFGRVPITRLSMGEGFIAAVSGERLNAHLHASASSAPAPVTANSCAATPEETIEVSERLRVDALLRCDANAVARTAGASVTTVLNLSDFYRAVTQPDSHMVGYHCVQRRDHPVTSHFVRFLSQSRALHRLRQRQLRELCDRESRGDGSNGLDDLSTAAASATFGPAIIPPLPLVSTNGPSTPLTIQAVGSTAAVTPISSSYHLERLLLLDCLGDTERILNEFN